MLANTSSIRYKDINRNFKICNSRTERLIINGYLEKVSYLDKNYNTDFIIRLSRKAMDILSKRFNFNHFYKTIAFEHDLKLSNIYLNISENCKASWKNEKQLKNIFEKRLLVLRRQEIKKYIILKNLYENNKISVIDGLYEDDLNKKIGIEVITKNYTDEAIKAKEKFSQIYNIELKKIKI